MTPEKAKSLGRKYSLQSAIYIFIILQLALLLSETSGDFANGILFYIENQMNTFSITLYVVCFLSFIFLGNRAGLKIIIHKANAIKIGIVHTCFTTVLLLAFLSIPLYEVLNMKGFYVISEKRQAISNFLLLSSSAFILFLLGWLLSVYRIKRMSSETIEA